MATQLLKSIAPSIWIADQSLRLAGSEVGARMTVVREPSGELVVISPVKYSEALGEQVRALGQIAWLVGPNAFHHIYLSGWSRAFPNAKLAGPPALVAKRKDLSFAAVLDGALPAGWPAGLEPLRVVGLPKADEVLFWHASSRTLITTDFLFNIPKDAGGAWQRFMLGLLQISGGPRQSRFFRFMVKDRAQVRSLCDRLKALPIERIVLAHGDVISTDAAGALSRAVAWLYA